MVTAMEDACPNGVREEEEVTAPGQPGAEGPPTVPSTQGTDTSGGEERGGKGGVSPPGRGEILQSLILF